MIKDVSFYYRKVGWSFLFNWGFIMIIHYRIGRWAYQTSLRKINPIWYLYILAKFFLQSISKIELPPTASIGQNLYLPHPYGLVMAANTVIGDDCSIGPWVVIGHLNKTGNPVIGNRVYIGPVACILGGIHIGDDAIIGAHALVVESIPPGARVLGLKGTIKS